MHTLAKERNRKMTLAQQNKWLGQKNVIVIFLLCFVFFMMGCGPSYEERKAKKEMDRKEQIRKKESKVKILSDQLLSQHNAVYFPPAGLGATAFTYELQRFLSANAQRSFLFKGYLEDVEKMEHGIIIEFLCPLGEDFYLNKTAIRFRLNVSEEKIKQVLSIKREDLMFRYLDEPNYFVVAKIDSLKRSRRYEFNGSADGDEVEIYVDFPPNFLSTGKLVDTIHIPND